MRTATPPLARIFAADALEGQRFAAWLRERGHRATVSEGRFPEVSAPLPQVRLNDLLGDFHREAVARERGLATR